MAHTVPCIFQGLWLTVTQDECMRIAICSPAAAKRSRAVHTVHCRFLAGSSEKKAIADLMGMAEWGEGAKSLGWNCCLATPALQWVRARWAGRLRPPQPVHMCRDAYRLVRPHIHSYCASSLCSKSLKLVHVAAQCTSTLLDDVVP